MHTSMMEKKEKEKSEQAKEREKSTRFRLFSLLTVINCPPNCQLSLLRKMAFIEQQ